MKLSPPTSLKRFAPRCLSGLLALWASLAVQSALAQSLPAPAYPQKTITLVVPFPPGGVADIVARPLADAMSKDLGQAVVIENKPGAGGGIGMGFVAHAKADGYTLLMSLSSLSVLPQADQILGRTPLFLHKDLRAVARFTADPTVLVVKADSPWASTKEWIEEAKKRPGQLSYGTSGNYGTMHVPMEMLAQNTGIKLNHIPYTGAGPAVVALLGGQIDAVATGPATVLQHIKAGKLRALAVGGSKRTPTLPDVPTIAESGVPGYEAVNWWGIVAPAGTPKFALDKLHKELSAIQNSPETVKRFQAEAVDTVQMSQSEFAQYLNQETAKWSRVVKEVGITPE